MLKVLPQFPLPLGAVPVAMPVPAYPVLLVDDDPVFRLGLRTVLGQFPDVQVVAEASSSAHALEFLQTAQRQAADQRRSSVRLVILDLGLRRTANSDLSGLELCQQLKQDYRDLPILLLSHPQDPVLTAAALQLGVEGYCPKGAAVAEVITAIRRVASGQPYWLMVPAIGLLPAASQSSKAARFSPWKRVSSQLGRWRTSGLTQIDQALAELQDSLDHTSPDRLTLEITRGRCRELRAARWLVSHLLPSVPSASPTNSWESLHQPPAIESLTAVPPTSLPVSATNPKALRSALLDSLVGQMQVSLPNLTDTPLEIDILREDKKRQLFYIILRKLEDLLEELQIAQVQPEQLTAQTSQLLCDLWRSTLTDFFGRYYTLMLGDKAQSVVDTLLAEESSVFASILATIPMVDILLGHLLFLTPIVVDQAVCTAGSIEAMRRVEMLLENLVIRLACAVMQPLLNRFANVEAIKQTFYDRRLMSTREVERFRNDLSWKYRLEKLVIQPKAIFESEYILFVLTEGGLKKQAIYAPRDQELAELRGTQLAVTLLLELRDAVAPRLQSVIAFLGSGLVYLLTEVVGRGIGLVGRGVLKGIGNAFQDSRRRSS